MAVVVSGGVLQGGVPVIPVSCCPSIIRIGDAAGPGWGWGCWHLRLERSCGSAEGEIDCRGDEGSDVPGAPGFGSLFFGTGFPGFWQFLPFLPVQPPSLFTNFARPEYPVTMDISAGMSP